MNQPGGEWQVTNRRRVALSKPNCHIPLIFTSNAKILALARRHTGLTGGTGMTLHLLLVDTDADGIRQLTAHLSEFGHRFAVAGSIAAAAASLDSDAFDAVIIAADDSHIDRIDLAARLRESGISAPIMILSRSARPIDKIECLDAGADDYMVKPADPGELNARLNAHVRARQFPRQSADTLRAGDIMVSPSRVRAWRDGQPLDLALTEFRLLVELVREAGAPVSRAELIARVWGTGFVPATNIVEAHIRRLRIKLARGGDDPIRTMRNVGYSIRI